MHPQAVDNATIGCPTRGSAACQQVRPNVSHTADNEAVRIHTQAQSHRAKAHSSKQYYVYATGQAGKRI